jgi:hypothetical protein
MSRFNPMWIRFVTTIVQALIDGHNDALLERLHMFVMPISNANTSLTLVIVFLDLDLDSRSVSSNTGRHTCSISQQNTNLAF